MSKVILLISVMILSSMMFTVFYMNHIIDQQNKQLNVLNKEIRQKEENIAILESEWSYLSRPERLSALADKYLKKMQPPQALQMSNYEDLSDNLDLDEDSFKKIQASYSK